MLHLSEVIVWNGGQTSFDQTRNNRFRQVTMRLYDPVSDTWRVPTNGWEPFVASIPRGLASGYSVAWTGDELFVIGKNRYDGAWIFDPAAERWREASIDSAPFYYTGSSTLWAGDRFIHWGGVISVFPVMSGKYFVP